MVVYAPGTEETDQKKQNIAIQQAAGLIAALQALGVSSLSNSIGADVATNSAGTYFDGPSVAQGTTGTWFVSGTVTVIDTGASRNFNCKLWDGTTVIASAAVSTAGANFADTVTLSGCLASPAGNLRISVSEAVGSLGKILFNSSGNSKDSTITAYRIA